MRSVFCVLVLALLFVSAFLQAPAMAADWFVAPSEVAGEGSIEKPFADPWRALAAAATGDVIHIAQGTYFGRYDRSAWVIDRPKLTILGGYDTSFENRDPWNQPTVFAFYSDYEGANENNILYGLGDHSGLVLDGIVVDGAGRNAYDTKPPFEFRRSMGMVSSLVSFQSPDVTIRNCCFINGATGAVELSGEGTVFENNIVVNHVSLAMLALRRSSGENRRPIVVRGNTFAFAYDDSEPPMGKGGEKGVGIRVDTPAQIENNVFAACGNAGINLFAPPKDVTIDRNVFWLDTRAHIAARVDGRNTVINDKNLDELEDLGFKSCQGNKAEDPGLTGLKGEWVDGVSRHFLFEYSTPPKEAFAALRTKYSLPAAVAPVDDKDHGPAAPRLEVRDAYALRVTTAAGAKPVECKVLLADKPKPVALVQYKAIGWDELNAGAPALDGKPIELVAAIGNERNGFVKPGITAEKYVGYDVFGGTGKTAEQIHIYAIRGASAHRQLDQANKSNNLRDAEDWYLLRGTCRLTGARQKATIEVDSIVATSIPPRDTTAKPKGREWFVRSGSSGGEGSREKPFRDPFLALEKANPGDVIRVAGGEYYGKLKAASWSIAARNLSLLGGYDAEFKVRDPWKNPTRITLPESTDKKDRKEHAGELLKSTEICDGLVLDGFIFDGSAINTYADASAGGALDIRTTRVAAMVHLQGSNVAIRNCLFANASGLAVDLSSASGVFENNVIVNSSGGALNIHAQGPGPWIVKRNTFLFAADPSSRAGSGTSSAGTLLRLAGRAACQVEGNIFALADNTAVYATVPQDKFAFNNNVLSGNLFAHFTDANRLWLYDSVWQRRVGDGAFISARDNSNQFPAGLPVDKEFLNKVLPRLFDLRSRYTSAEWSKIATASGASVSPAGNVQDAAKEPANDDAAKGKPPKEASLDDLMADLNKMKDEAKGKTAAAPQGPPYCPAYPWQTALDLFRDPASAVGAVRTLAGAEDTAK